MRLRSLSFAAALAVAPCALFSQVRCDNQNCAFTLAFGRNSAGAVAEVSGAPYSGQMSYAQTRTLADGTHTASQRAEGMAYRDSSGRVRTEYSVYNLRANQPPPPDNFTVAEIRDPVAGFDYILDPVSHVAHRMKYDPGPVRKWQGLSQPFGGPVTVEQLGTQAISGVAAMGRRITRSGPGGNIASTEEAWFDPQTGAPLLRTSSSPNGDTTTATMLNYRNSEPDPALFKIPEGYRVADETGTFQVVHARVGDTNALSASGRQTPQREVTNCQDRSCRTMFSLASQQPIAAITGAPYSGRETREVAAHTAPNGNQIPGRTIVVDTAYRDAQGRVRTERLAQGNGGMPAAQRAGIDIVEIDDPVAGYECILDPVNHTAYRVAYQPRIVPFTQHPNFQPAGTHTFPNGTVDTEEELGTQTVDGVAAIGHRTTQTHPTGTIQANDKPVVQVTERWVDPRTGIVLIAKQSGSYGNTTQAMQAYKATDPDPSLFLIPSDYKTVDETGRFSVAIPVNQ